MKIYYGRLVTYETNLSKWQKENIKNEEYKERTKQPDKTSVSFKS